MRITADLNKLASECGYFGPDRVKHLLYEDIQEKRILVRDSQRARVVGTVYESDPMAKALTGRTPKIIEEETGISKEIMFPPDKTILYVGDPWQRMEKEIDSPNLTIIDYEFGETASFITDNEAFREGINRTGGCLLQTVSGLLESGDWQAEDNQWLVEFRDLVDKSYQVSLSAEGFDDYSKAAVAWSEAKEHIEKNYREQLDKISAEEQSDPCDLINRGDPLSIFRTEAWYDCIYGERGFRDIPDFNNKILPKIEAKRKELQEKGVSAEEIENEIEGWKKTWIDEIRLVKKTKKAYVVEAVFPELPFKPESFDRFVASWSISTHTFAELDEEGFATCWREIKRVLKDDGEAWIFPLDYYWNPDRVFLDSLEQSGMEWQMYDSYGEPVEWTEEAHTLWLGNRR